MTSRAAHCPKNAVDLYADCADTANDVATRLTKAGSAKVSYSRNSPERMLEVNFTLTLPAESSFLRKLELAVKKMNCDGAGIKFPRSSGWREFTVRIPLAELFKSAEHSNNRYAISQAFQTSAILGDLRDFVALAERCQIANSVNQPKFNR